MKMVWGGIQMTWKPNKAPGMPIYKQIAHYIESRIVNGEFPPGSFLPSERHLAEELKVNRSTVIAAYDELTSTGLINKVKGTGTIVSTDIWGANQQRVPNWEQYIKGGFFQPNNPLNRQIHRVTQSQADIINFAIGELSHDLLPIHLIQDVHSSMDISRYLGYEHMQGNIKLRETISSHLLSYRSIESTPEAILITSGAQQAIHLIIQCLLKPGDAIAIEDPSYAYSLPIFQSAGLRTFLLPVEHDGIDPERIVALHRKHRLKMMFLNPIFHNPTGTILSMEKRKRILEISTKFGIPIVEDDPYSITGYNHERIHTLKSLDQYGTVLYVSSLTKLIASGLRIGWIVGPHSVINRLADVKQQIDFGHPNYPQWIAAQLLSSPDFAKHIKHLREGLKKKRDIIVETLKSELGNRVSFTIPEGGIHLWCSIAEDVNETILLKEAVRKKVVFAPGSTLGSSNGTVRFTYGRCDTNLIREGVKRFAEALNIATAKA
jgi:GntR family transcriptional regulator of abcA and norABC